MIDNRSIMAVNCGIVGARWVACWSER